MSEWRQVPLGSVARVVPGYAFKSKDWCDNGVPVLKIKNIQGNGTIDIENVDRVPAAILSPRLKKFEVCDNDILLAMTGATAGKVGRLRSPKRFMLNQRVAKLIPVDVDPTFFWSLVSSDEYQNRFFRLADGAAQPNMSGAQIEGILIPLPPIETQRRIASILGAYDDLVEVNRRRIAVLEEMARGLFESFITKVIGELPPASGGSGNAALPDGWHITDLRDITEIIMGQSPPSEELNKDGDGFPFHQGVTDFGPLFPRRRIFCVPSSKKKIAATGDILFSVRAPVGRINLATEEVVLGRGVSSFRSTIGTQHYLAAHLRATFYEPDLIGNGSIYKAVGRNDIQRIPIVLPPAEIRAELDVKIASIYDLLWTLEQSNKALAASRDLLLPRLISGQLSVAKAERQLEEAA